MCDWACTFLSPGRLIQAVEVLGSTQVCSTQQTFPKISRVKKYKYKCTHNTYRVTESTPFWRTEEKKKNITWVESWIVSKSDEWCGGIVARTCKEKIQILPLNMPEISLLNVLTFHFCKRFVLKYIFVAPYLFRSLEFGPHSNTLQVKESNSCKKHSLWKRL